MNRLQYRIVFNKQRGQLMAVAETVRGQGKGAAGESDGPSRRALTSEASVPAVSRGPPALLGLVAAMVMSMALTAALTLSPDAQAQIKPDATAPKNQQPTVLTAPNGTPLVNIQTPSAAGVSRNTYSQFDVNPSGVILNNSRVETSTQLGGWVQGNPWLAKGEARVILNEVNSSNPSQLKGFVEVGGRRAEVVIANPAGIVVDGAGFINASSATLTTGTARWGADGSLTGFGVQGGLIRIDGQGLDASQTDYTALLARAVEINAGLWAKDVRIGTGTQVMNATLGAGETLTPAGERPRYALDSTALGGIYAQRITLVGTEDGLGVRQAGQLIAAQLTLNAQGWLDNTGTVYAQDAAPVNGEAALTVRMSQGVRNAGWLAAKGSATLSGGQLQGEAGSVTAAGLNDDGTLTAGAGNLTLTAEGLSRQAGQVLAGAALQASGDLFDAAGAQFQAARIQLSAAALRADNAQLFSTGTLDLRSGGLLSTRGASLVGQQLLIAATDLDNTRGEWLHLGSEALTVSVSGSLMTDGGRIASNGREFVLSAAQLSGVQARLEHYGSGTMRLSAVDADLRGAALSANGALEVSAGRLQLDSADVLGRSVQLQSEGALSLRQAVVRSSGATSLSADSLDNRGGQVLADAGLAVQARLSIQNDGGQLQAAQGGLSLSGQGALSNRAGIIAARDAVSIQAASLSQEQGGLVSGQDVQLRLQGGLVQDSEGKGAGGASSVVAARDLTIDARTVNSQGVLRAGTSATLATADSASLGGSVYAGTSLRVTAGTDLSITGLFGSQVDASAHSGRALTASATSTMAAGLLADGRIAERGTLTVSSVQTSLQGQVLAADAALSAQQLDLSRSRLSVGHGVTLQSTQFLITEGATLRSGSLSLQATDWRNAGGMVAVSGDGAWTVALAGQLDNRSGVIQTNSREASINAQSLDNTGGVLSTSGAAMRVQTGQLQNQDGLLSAGGLLDLNAQSLFNRDGQVTARSMQIQATTLDNAGDGVIAATAGTLRLDGVQLTNAGSIQANGDLLVRTTGVLDNSGLMRAQGQQQGQAQAQGQAQDSSAPAQLQMQAGTLRHSGTMAAQGALSVDATRIDSSGTFAAGLLADNTIGAQGDLTLHATQALQHSGAALAGGRLTLDGETVDLRSSQLQAAQLTIGARTGELQLSRTTIATAGLLALSSQSTLHTEGAKLSGSDVTITATDWRNTGGEIAQTSAAGRLDIQVAGLLDNATGQIHANATDAAVRAQTLDNAQGAIVHAGTGHLAVDATTLNGASGSLLTNGALTLTVTGAADLSQAKTQGQRVSVTSGSLNHQGGEMIGVFGLEVSVANAVNNVGGLLQSGGDVQVQAAVLENGNGQIDGTAIRLTGGSVSNGAQGLIAARQGLSVDVTQLANAGSLQAGAAMTLNATGPVTNSGQVYAQGPLSVHAGTTLTHTGTLAALGAVEVQADRIASSGLIAAGLKSDNTWASTGDLTLRVTDSLQHSGQLAAAGRLSATAGSLQLQDSRVLAQQIDLIARNALGAQNSQSAQTSELRLDRAQVVTAGVLTLDSAGALITSGATLSASTVQLRATDWTHIGGQLAQTSATGSLSATVQGRIDNTDGVIAANAQDLTLRATELVNTRGNLTHAGSGALHVEVGDLSGAQGQVLSAGALALDVVGNALLNGSKTQAATVTLNAGSLQHQAGQLISVADARLQITGSADNTGGVLHSSADLHLQAGALDNRDGQIGARAIELTTTTFSNGGQGLVSAQGALTLTSGELANAGTLQSVGALGLTVTGNAQNSGLIYTQGIGSVQVGGTLQHTGTLAAQGALTVDVGALSGTGTLVAGLKPDNTLAASGDLTVRAQQALQNSGSMLAAGTMTLSGASLLLQDSRLQAAQATLTASSGPLQLDRAVLASAGALSLTSAQGVLVTDGAQLSGSNIDIRAQDWRNVGGEVAQTGSTGSFTAVVGGTLNNRSGQIQATGATLSLDAQVLDNTLGRLAQAAAGTTTLRVGTLQGHAGQVLTNGQLTLRAMGAVDLSQAQTQASGVTLTASSLNHQGAQLLSTGTTTIDVTGQLNNSAGTVASAGTLEVHSGSLINASNGLLQGDGAATLRVDGTLDNQGGKLRAGGDLALTAGRIDNRSGWAGADGALTVQSTAELLNGSGSLVSQRALTIDASAVGNQLGRIGSLQGAVTLRSGGAIDNTQGRVQAAQALSVIGSGVTNQQGELSGTVLTVDTRGLALNNRDGQMLASQSLSSVSGAFDNAGGLVQSLGDLTLRTQGGTLSNARSATGTVAGTPTGIHAQGNLTLNAGALVNEAGISAAGSAQIDASQLTNRAELSAGTALTAKVAGTLDNEGGRLIGAQTLDATAQQVLNQRGLIYGGQTLTLRGGSRIDNNNTSGTGQGLQGGNVSLIATQLDNRAGQVLASGDLALTVGQSLDNANGQLGAVGRQTIGDGGAASASALALNNASGRIWSGAAMGVGVRELTGGVAGQISSGGSLSLTLAGDFTYGAGSQLQSSGNTVLTVSGAFTNQGTLRSGGTLSIGASSIDNQASGELSGTVTLLNASGTLTNRGLIDGDAVGLTADRLLNLGSGRIYGGDIVLTAGQLVNDKEGGAAAVIAARNTLDVQLSRDLINRNGALMYADGGMRLVADSLLNENATIESSQWLEISTRNGLINRTVYDGLSTGEGTGLGNLASKSFISSGGDMLIHAGSVLNSGATIEARGDLSMTSGTIQNLNPYLMWTAATGDGKLRFTYSIENQAFEDHIAVVDLKGRSPDQALSDYFDSHPTHRLIDNLGATGDRTEVTQSAAGRIMVGGRLSVTGSTITNDMSVVVGSDGVAITGAAVNNVTHYVSAWDSSTGTQRQLALTLPTTATAYAPAGVKPSVRSAAGTVSTGGGASSQQAQGGSAANASGGSGLSGLVTRMLSQVNAANGAPANTSVNTAWRAGSEASAQAVNAAQAGQGGVSASASQQSGRAGLIAMLREASAAVVGADADGRAKAAAVAQAVSTGGATTAQDRPGTGRLVTLNSANATFNGKPLAHSVGANLTLPTNSLFKLHTEPTSRYLIETDPRFANYRDWLSSDYLLQQLAVDPATTQKRLGDGFYEQRLVREQIGQLTGTTFLEGYADDEAMYRALLSNGASFAKAHELRPGIALTAEQMTQLTTDLVWLVEQTVTLADGTTQRVLVPQVYLVPRDGDLLPSGALIAGNRVEMALSGDFNNTGSVRGGDVAITAQNIANAGDVRGTSLALSAREDLRNLGGTLASTGDMSLTAGRDIVMESSTASGTLQRGNVTTKATILDQVATLSAGGVMVAQAGRDVSLQATQITQGQDGKGTDGGVVIQAGRDLTLSTVQIASSRDEIKNATNFKKESLTQDVGTTVQGEGVVVLKAGQDLTATAAALKSSDAGVTLAAGRDVSLLAGEANQVIEQMTQKTKKSVVKKKTTTTYNKSDETTAIGTTVSGDTVDVLAGQDLKLVAANVVSDTGTALQAGRDISIEGATNTLETEQFKKTVKSGLMSGGGIGFSIGKQSLAQTTKTTQETNSGSTVASVGGDVSIVAGNAYRQVGSDIAAPGGDVSIQGKSIDVLESRNQQAQDTQTKFKQSGVTVSLSIPGVSTAMEAVKAGEHVTQTEDDRMKALAAATAISKAMQAQKEIANFEQLSSEAQKQSIRFNVSVGSSKSTSQQASTSDQAAGSSILAGDKLSLVATGGSQASNVTVRGGSLSGQEVLIKADNAINLVAATNTSEQHSSNKSSSASVGVGFQLGADNKFGFTASGSVTKGNSDGVDKSFTATEVKGGTSVTLQSGGDTTLQGAVVTAPTVKAQVGGDLQIESQQDTAKFDSKSSTVGGSVTVGYGAGGSANYSKSKVDADYAAVGTQAGIRAGDGGFQVEVKGNTDLKGGAITSSQAAIDAGKNSLSTGTLTTSDIDNRSQYSASAVTVSAGTSGGMAGAYKDSGEERSTTKSTISAGVTTITSGDASSQAVLEKLDRGATNDATAGKLAQGWDGQKLAEQVKVNAQIVAEFGAQAAKEVGDFAASKTKPYDEAKLKRDAAQAVLDDPNADPSMRTVAKEMRANAVAVMAQQQETYDQWMEGGASRVALHAVVGALTGDLNGALGAAGSAAAAGRLDDFQAAVAQKLKDAGLGGDETGANNWAKALSTLASGALATGTGAIAGGGFNGAAAGLNQDYNNRQLHPAERKKAAELAKKSGGKYTQQQIEDAMRNSGNSEYKEDITAGMVVRDPAVPNAFYDSGAPFTTGDNGKTFVQINRNNSSLDPSYVEPDLAAYIRANTGGANSPYYDLVSSKPSYTVPTSTSKSGGLNYQMKTANGESFRLAVADCPAATCQSTDNIARFGLDAADQAQLDAYTAALKKEQAKDAVKAGIAVGVAVTAPVSVSGALVGGAIVGGASSATDQYIDSGEVNGVKVVREAAIGAVIGGGSVLAFGAIGAIVQKTGQSLDALVAAKLVSQADAEAYLAAQNVARINNNISRDDAAYFSETYFKLRQQTEAARASLPELVGEGGKPIGNVAAAEISVYGKSTEQMRASSRVGNDPASAKSGFASLPPAENMILKDISQEGSIPRYYDTEFKILEAFAQRNVGNRTVAGQISIYTERSPCNSCTDLMRRTFSEIFPNMEVRLYHGNGEITVIDSGVKSNVLVPDLNRYKWPAAPGLPVVPRKDK
ncbi:hemagglutinin repeat-containing protein [Roseateles amylovorans]|uniref:Hemagglutinin repeat-containing protein n=1 Tax=Roseateles amylovorans TaxID=2978473 RepID=A0ABY6AWT7_9BURK|nr:hemagglutinin repeat-containing protein [Roseateles amylovorans]UXH77378.1 hemagglutinin repeat-containing protein [Roseateles amylovorans]